MKVVTTCLKPVRYDILIDGVRYGYVFEEPYFNWVTKEYSVRWKARMDSPEHLDFRFSGHLEEGETLDKAVFRAFEEFVRSDAMTQDGFARIGMALFGERDEPEAVFVESVGEAI